MKIKAVWDDSDDTSEEAEIEDNSLLDIIPAQKSPRRKAINKGKERQVFEPLELASGTEEEFEDYDGGEEDGGDREMRSARALVPTDGGDYVHPHETNEMGRSFSRSRSGTATRLTTPRAGSITHERHTHDDDDSSEEEENGERRESREPVPWPAQIGIEPHRVHVMQQSFFHTKNPAKDRPPQQTQIQRTGFLLAAGQKRTREASVHTPGNQVQNVRFFITSTSFVIHL